MVPIGGGAIARDFPTLLRDLALLALGLAVYGALFAAVGAWLKRPVLLGLFFAFGWENFALALPGYMKRFTVAFYTAEPGSPRHAPGQRPVDPPVVLQGQCLGAAGRVALVAMLVVALALATRAVERREYVLEQ